MGVFDNLRHAFREAVSNFKEEVNREDIPEAVDSLLRGMVAEVTDTKAYVKRLTGEIEQTEAKAARERKNADTCRRRETMAREIGDEETARVAAEYAEKHERATAVLEEKAQALRNEQRLKAAEVEEMLAKIKQARADKDRLIATAGRARSRETMTEVDDLFAEMDRFADKIGDTENQAAAARDLGDEIDPLSRVDPDLERQFDDLEDGPSQTVDERLAELKRRMGRD